jgi:uncharacterized protein YyaL (SSP411 family)
LIALTDDTGVFQHAKFCIPKRSEGYTTDDNARALIAAIKYHKLKNDSQMIKLAGVYLAFLNHMQKPDGNFHNYLAYERTFLDVDGSEDCMGRTLWACGVALNSKLPEDMKFVAKDIFDKCLPTVWKTTSLRFYAGTILGLTEYYQALQQNDMRIDVEKLSESLLQRYRDQKKDDWQWFEPYLTYDNARLPQALFLAYRLLGKKELLDAAVESLNFLLKTQLVGGIFVPIGNDGWFKRGEKRALYDQQPLEAAAMVDAAIEAYYATGKKRYIEASEQVFSWFLGKNSRGLMIYNPETTGCFDGLSPHTVNANQGAESSISYLLARLKLEELKQGTTRLKTSWLR